jgi:DNA-directed RNA polymerase sigma subunit (sigma70/sigma32)
MDFRYDILEGMDKTEGKMRKTMDKIHGAIELPPEEKLLRAIFHIDTGSARCRSEVNGVPLKEAIESALSTLPERPRMVLRIRFGFNNQYLSDTNPSLAEVGPVFNVTRERIRQIEGKALRRLRHWTRSRQLKPYLEVISEHSEQNS